MAIITIGAPLSGIRGTVGGITFSANKSGPYAKIWSQTTNPRTPQQSRERGFMARMSSLWNALTGVQKAAWDTFAALPAQDLTNSLGETFSASGYNWFTKCNIRLLRVGLTPLVPVPTQARPAAPTITEFRVTLAGTETDLVVGGTPSASTQDAAHLAPDAFDNNASTYWGTFPLFAPTGWIRYDLPSAENVTKYTILESAAAGSAKRPKDWNFQVFTAAAWTTIHSVTNYVFPGGVPQTFFFPNAFTETNYRWDITANNGDANQVAVAELEMFAGLEGSSVITYPEDEFAATPDYDLILHVALGRSTGQAVMFPGFAETLALAAPGRDHELIQSPLEAIYGTTLLDRSWFAQLYRQTTQGLRSAPATARTETIGP